MYLRLRKRRKPLPTDTSPAPLLGGEEASAPAQSDWVPPEPTAEGAEGGTDAPGTDISTSRHPNRGKARESARGSHR